MDAQKDRALALLEIADAGARANRDRVVLARGGEQKLLQIGAMEQPERRAPALAGAGEFESREDRAVPGAMNVDRLGQQRRRAQRLAKAEPLEDSPGVGGDLQPGADLLDDSSALQHRDAMAGAREAERGGQPANSGAGDDDRRAWGVVQDARRKRRAIADGAAG